MFKTSPAMAIWETNKGANMTRLSESGASGFEVGDASICLGRLHVTQSTLLITLPISPTLHDALTLDHINRYPFSRKTSRNPQR